MYCFWLYNSFLYLLLLFLYLTTLWWLYFNYWLLIILQFSYNFNCFRFFLYLFIECIHLNTLTSISNVFIKVILWRIQRYWRDVISIFMEWTVFYILRYRRQIYSAEYSRWLRRCYWTIRRSRQLSLHSIVVIETRIWIRMHGWIIYELSHS